MGECNGSLFYAIGFLLFSVANNMAQIRNKEVWNRMLSGTAVVIMLVAFMLGGLIIGYDLPTAPEAAAFVTTAIGVFVFFMYKEPPQALAVSDS